MEAETTPIHHGSLIASPPGDSLCGHDIALVRTQENVDVTPLELALDERPVEGDAYTAVGYGFLGELVGGEGTRRSLAGLHFECDQAGCAPTLVDGEVRGAAGPCEGDSGGPALDEQGRVVAVLSRGTVNCESPIYVTLFAHREWLRAETRKAAEAGGYPFPRWAREPAVQDPGVTGAGGSPALGMGASGEGGRSPEPQDTDGILHPPTSPDDTGASCSFLSGPSELHGPALTMGALTAGAFLARRTRLRSSSRS